MGDCANSCHTPTKYYAAEGKRQRQILRKESITQKQRHTQRHGQREEGTVLTHATLQQSTMQQREKDKDKYFEKKVLLRNNDTHKDMDKERRGCANSCHTPTKYY